MKKSAMKCSRRLPSFFMKVLTLQNAGKISKTLLKHIREKLSVPLVARMVESSLREVDQGVVEAAQSMGATPMQIIARVLLPEAMPNIVAQLTTVVISLVGESAMAGAIGGGGLGDLAIRYGYQRFRPDIMIATVVVLIVMVQVVQFAGNALAKKLDKR